MRGSSLFLDLIIWEVEYQQVQRFKSLLGNFELETCFNDQEREEKFQDDIEKLKEGRINYALAQRFVFKWTKLIEKQGTYEAQQFWEDLTDYLKEWERGKGFESEWKKQLDIFSEKMEAFFLLGSENITDGKPFFQLGRIKEDNEKGLIIATQNRKGFGLNNPSIFVINFHQKYFLVYIIESYRHINPRNLYVELFLKEDWVWKDYPWIIHSLGSLSSSNHPIYHSRNIVKINIMSELIIIKTSNSQELKKTNKKNNMEKDKQNKDWKNIGLNFTEELKNQWKTRGFDYEECKEWIDIGLRLEDADFAYYLSVNEKDPEQCLNHGNIDELRKEYSDSVAEKSDEIKVASEVEEIESEEFYEEYFSETETEDEVSEREMESSEEENSSELEISETSESENESSEEIMTSDESEDNRGEETWEDTDSTLELQKLWKNKGFNYEALKEWMNIGLKTDDVDYEKWLRDDEKLKEKIGKFLNHIYDDELKEPKTENKQRNRDFCKDCSQPLGYERWCRFCNSQYFRENFKNWTSGNSEIDKFIQEYQLKATNNWQILEWIPYERFRNIEYLAEGGFGIVYKAEWIIDFFSTIHISEHRKKRVALKSLKDSQKVTTDFLQEIVKYKLLVINPNIVGCYGISQDPKTKDYVMVMEYIEGGSFREYLKSGWDSEFENTIFILYRIAIGLETIHKKGLIHCDLHPGNILKNDDFCHITDLGLCRPANEVDETKVFGILPYVAPEVLHGKPYASASDIYSFSIIAYELFFGLPPYHGCFHDCFLATKIMQGLRPDLNIVKIPQFLKNIIIKCWNSDPSQRLTADELVVILGKEYNNVREDTEFSSQYSEIEAERFKNFKNWLREDKEREGGLKNWDLVLSKIEQKKYIDKWIEIDRSYSIKKYLELFKEWEKKVEKRSNSNYSESYSRITYTSSLLNFPSLPEPRNNPSQEWQTFTLLELQMKTLEEEINLLKKPLDSEIKQLVDNFIQARKEMIKNKKDKEIRNKVKELDEKMVGKGLLKEKIKDIIRCCERLVELERKMENDQFQANVEVFTNKY